MSSSAWSRSEDENVAATLQNTVVLRKILSYLNFNTLKNCSLVCQFWKYEVRSYIRDFRQCNVKISPVRPCLHLFHLNTLVDQMTSVPINSLSIDLGPNHRHGDCIFRPDESEVYENLLKKLQIKYLSVSVHSNFEAHRCPAKKFFRAAICAVSSMELRTLTFSQVPPDFHRFFDKDWTPCFPKLTVLKFGTLDADHQSVSKWIGPQNDFFVKIINGAPNLKQIAGYFDPDALEFLPKVTYSLLKEFHLFIRSAKHEKICWELVEAKPALLYLVMDTSETLSKYRNSFFRVLEQLLTSSYRSVNKLTMQFSIFPLNQLSFPPLLNLKILEIETGATPEQVLSALRPFDYSKQLPSLTQVQICSEPECDSGDTLIIPSLNSATSSSLLQPSMTVKKLRLEADVTRMTFNDMSKIFPGITQLEVSLRVEFRIVTPYANLWASWSQLESISIVEGRGTLGRNFDAEFLGIHSDELEILREMDDESLEKMHIVPAKPSVASMLRLKVLKIEFEQQCDFCGDLPADQVFLSKVAGVALRKLTKTGTSVQFVCRNPKIFSRLNHLRPFASVVFEKVI